MGYPGWQIAKWKKERTKNQKPYKKMKDRNMTGVTVCFTRSPKIQGAYSYYFHEIKQKDDKITINYIANLSGRRGVNKYWTWHGYGGWIQYLTLDESEFNQMKDGVLRLGGSVILMKKGDK